MAHPISRLREQMKTSVLKKARLKCEELMGTKELDNLLEIADKNLKGCHPLLQSKVLCLIADLYTKEGLCFSVFTGLRSKKVQDALYAQGRKGVITVNKLRVAAGLPKISMRQNANPVTTVKTSWHNFGVAADLVEDGDPNKVGMQWSWRQASNYLKIGKYAKANGLNWGGFWHSFKDYPHVELKMNISLSEASTKTVKEVWTEVNNES